MRGRLFNFRALARVAGCALVAVAIVAVAIHGRHDLSPRPARIAVTPLTDPLAQEMIRCEALGMAAEQDARCKAAWAENRQRFFTYRAEDRNSRKAQTRNHAVSNAEDR